jgi:hypothetical protein
MVAQKTPRLRRCQSQRAHATSSDNPTPLARERRLREMRYNSARASVHNTDTPMRSDFAALPGHRSTIFITCVSHSVLNLHFALLPCYLQQPCHALTLPRIGNQMSLGKR